MLLKRFQGELPALQRAVEEARAEFELAQHENWKGRAELRDNLIRCETAC